MNMMFVENMKTALSRGIDHTVQILKWPPLFAYLVLGLVFELLERGNEAKLVFVIFLAFWILKFVLVKFSKERTSLGLTEGARVDMVVAGIRGTLTMDNPRVTRVLSPFDVTNFTGSLRSERYYPLSGDALDALGWGILASSDSKMNDALAQIAKKEDVDVENLTRNFKRLGEVPYDDKYRMSASLFALQHLDRSRLVLIGDARAIVERSRAVAQDGMTIPLGEEDRAQLLAFVDHAESKSSRMFAVAYLDLAGEVSLLDMEALERDVLASHTIAFGAFIVLDDPLEHGALGAMSSLRRVQIPLVIATGNSAYYALAVMGASGGVSDPLLVVEGDTFDGMSRDDIVQAARAGKMFVNMHTERKERLENALEGAGVLFISPYINEDLPEMVARIAIARDRNETKVVRADFSLVAFLVIVASAVFSRMELVHVIFLSVFPLLLLQFGFNSTKYDGSIDTDILLQGGQGLHGGRLKKYPLLLSVVIIFLVEMFWIEHLMLAMGYSGSMIGAYEVVMLSTSLILLSLAFVKMRMNVWQYGALMLLRFGISILPALLVFAVIHFTTGACGLLQVCNVMDEGISWYVILAFALVPFAAVESIKYIFRK